MQAGLGCVRLWVQAVLGGSEGVGAGRCGLCEGVGTGRCGGDEDVKNRQV